MAINLPISDCQRSAILTSDQTPSPPIEFESSTTSSQGAYIVIQNRMREAGVLKKGPKYFSKGDGLRTTAGCCYGFLFVSLVKSGYLQRFSMLGITD